ncbi:MAG: CHASE2 domain-containing protein, partial [Spirochaetota bacterium]|nr:CHASE2 domain-containing protein [Spirochaetota bacterium]
MKKAFEAVFKIESLLFVLIVGLITLLYIIGWFTRIENMYLDAMTNTLTDTTVKIESKVVYSNTSDSCFKEAESHYQMGWPWKRASYNKIIDFVKQSGGKLTVFDATSTEKSVYSYLGLNDDEDFARFIQKSGNVIYGMVLGSNKKQLYEEQQQVLLRFMNLRTVPENDKEWLSRMKTELQKDHLTKLKLSQKDLETIKASKLLGLMKENGLFQDKVLAKKLARAKVKETEEKRNTRIRKLLTPGRLKKIGHGPDDAKAADSKKLSDLLFKVLIARRVKVTNKPSIVRNAIPNNKIKVIDKVNYIPEQFSYSPPTKALETAPLQLGTVHGAHDVDGIVRRKPLLVKYGDYYYPSLAFAAVYQYLKPEFIEIRKASITLVNPVDKIKRTIHLTQNGDLRLKYYGVSSAYTSFRNIDMFRSYDHINDIYAAYKKVKGIKHIDKAKLFEHSKYIFQVRKAIQKTHPHLLKTLSPRQANAKFMGANVNPYKRLSPKELRVAAVRKNIDIYKKLTAKEMRGAKRKRNPGGYEKLSANELKMVLKKRNAVYYRKLSTGELQQNKMIRKKILMPLSDHDVNRVKPEHFKGKIVLMGNKASSLQDIRSTPLDNKEMGTHIHATAIDNILKNDIIREVRGSWYVWLAIIILGLLTFIFT